MGINKAPIKCILLTSFKIVKIPRDVEMMKINRPRGPVIIIVKRVRRVRIAIESFE